MTDKTDTSTEAVEQALAEMDDIVRCRCHEVYTGRGLQDPDCQCDSADAVATLRSLAAERDALQARVTEARNEALEEAARVAGVDFFENALTPSASEHAAQIEEAIRALKE